MGKAYYTPRAAAAKLGVSPEELVQLVRENRLQVRRDGDRKLFRIEEVDALAAERARARAGGGPAGLAEDDRVRLEQADQPSGSGLLELTSERSAGWSDAFDRTAKEGTITWGMGIAPGSGEAWMTAKEAAAALGVSVQAVEERAEAGELESRLRPDGAREVLVTAGPITGTVLGMANRLAAAQQAELRRARRTGLLGWIAVALLLAGGVTALWRTTDLAGMLQLQRERTVNLTQDLSESRASLNEEKARTNRLTGEVETLRSDLRRQQAERERLQGELTTAREALAESGANVKVLTGRLDAAEAKASALGAELAVLKSRLAEVTAELERLRAAGATTRPALTP